MLGIFKKKTEKEVLYEKYKKLIEDAHRLSTVNRSQSDKKISEAESVMKQIESIS